ncbi:MAG: serine--tRNA ligase [Candidatus Omnitrophica bacterium]|nr:serine--tRNA ligase [Candidatus Omnitrophota bacterium]
MLDLKLIREEPEIVKQELARKGIKPEVIGRLFGLDSQRRALIQEVDLLKASRNRANDEISRAKKEGKPANTLIDGMKSISQKIDNIDIKVGDIDTKIEETILIVPNLPDKTVPDGFGANSNKVVREWGGAPKLPFKPKDHIELGTKLGWFSFERATKLSGSGFALFQAEGARLVRALMNLMLDLHTKKHGYQEVWPPALVNRTSMTGTGQLPKMEEDMYKLKDDDFFLIPTAEVPVSNIHRDEILNEKDLPIKYVAYSPCFRREAGSYGKDTRGLSRVHQFDKVELVKFVKPEESLNELELLVKDAEAVLQLLELPYRVVLLCAGDLSFAAAKCYDLEVYAPGMDKWFEVSSCSTFGDFQARRMNIKFKSEKGGKAQYIHTLNGSGVAFARTILCLLENHQQADGSIKIPSALKPYFG